MANKRTQKEAIKKNKIKRNKGTVKNDLDVKRINKEEAATKKTEEAV